MFPKVSPKLIKDLISRQMQFPNKLPVFTLEVFIKKIEEGGIDGNTIREHIWNTTGKMPGIYDNGTHYVPVIQPFFFCFHILIKTEVRNWAHLKIYFLYDAN
jgi:hypothetical protein